MMRPRFQTPFAAAGLAVLCFLACSADSVQQEAPASREPSLILVSIDTWRWDYIGAAGAGKVATPVLDDLAEQGLYVKETVVPCPLTTPAHASLFTGLGLLEHGVMDCSAYRLREGVETLAEAFKNEGFRTAAFVSSATLKAHYGLDRGFEVYDDRCDQGGEVDAIGRGARRDGAATLREVEAYLARTGAQERQFLWVHFFDLHLPYVARPGLDAKYPDDPYAMQVAFVDGLMGELREMLRGDEGRSWRMVIVGDHGEGLGYRGEAEHGFGLYRSTLHVPLIFHPHPGSDGGEGPWALVDIPPTLRHWMGLPELAVGDGVNRMREGRGERPIAALTVLPTLMLGVQPPLAVRIGSWMYLRHGAEEFYDLEADPVQKTDLSGQAAAAPALSRARAECDAIFPPNRLEEAMVPTRVLSAEEEKQLRSLGYLGGTVAAGRSYQRADLRDVLKDWAVLDHARNTVRSDPRAMITVLGPLMQRYPRSATLAKDYARALVQTRRAAEAVTVLESALEWNPESIGLLSNLGMMYARMGRGDEAEDLMLRALILQEDNVGVQRNIATLYAGVLRRHSDAVRHYKRLLELHPQDPDRARIEAYIQKVEAASKRP